MVLFLCCYMCVTNGIVQLGSGDNFVTHITFLFWRERIWPNTMKASVALYSQKTTKQNKKQTKKKHKVFSHKYDKLVALMANYMAKQVYVLLQFAISARTCCPSRRLRWMFWLKRWCYGWVIHRTRSIETSAVFFYVWVLGHSGFPSGCNGWNFKFGWTIPLTETRQSPIIILSLFPAPKSQHLG